MLGCLASLYSQEHFTFRAFSFEIFIYFPFHTQFPLRKKKRKKGGEEVKMSSSVVSTCVRLALMWSRCVTWDTVKKRFWTKPSDDGMEMWYFMKLKKINLLPSYQQMTLVDKNMRKYARKSFLFSCRCWFFSPLSLFVSCADYFFLLRAWLLLTLTSCRFLFHRLRNVAWTTNFPSCCRRKLCAFILRRHRRRYNTLFNTFWWYCRSLVVITSEISSPVTAAKSGLMNTQRLLISG